MPPFSQAAASHRLYPWGPSLWLPAAPGPAVRLPAAPQLVLPPCKTIPGLTRAVRKRWKPSCPSHSPCRDAGLRPRPPGHRRRRAHPPPHRRPSSSSSSAQAGGHAAPGPRAACPQQPAALRCWQKGRIRCRRERLQGSRRFRCSGRPSLRGTQEQPSALGPLAPRSCPGVMRQCLQRWTHHPLGTSRGFAARWWGRAGRAGERHSRATERLTAWSRSARTGVHGARERGPRAEVFSAQPQLLLCHLVLALGQQQIQLCCYVLPCRNVQRL